MNNDKLIDAIIALSIENVELRAENGRLEQELHNIKHPEDAEKNRWLTYKIEKPKPEEPKEPDDFDLDAFIESL